MRQVSRFAALAAAAGIAVTACGGATNVLQGKSPQQIVTLASTSIDQNAYHIAVHGTLNVDTSGITGVSQQEFGQFGSLLQNLTIDGSGDVQSTQRMRLNLTLEPLLAKQISLVLYDGSAFVSQDGGKTWADAGGFDFNGLPVSPGDITSILKDLGTVQDQGSESRNGQTVEKLHAVLGQDFVNKVFSQASGSADARSKMFLQLISKVMTVQNGGVDLFVRHGDGRLDSENTDATIAIDMGKLLSVLSQALGGMLPGGAGSGVSGAMVLKEAVSTTFSNYGEKVTITKPAVDPNAPGLPGAGGLFGA